MTEEKKTKMVQTYREAGVDVLEGDLFVSSLKGMVKRTYTPQVAAGIGGYASLYDLGDRYICGTTDGVGTKILLAQKLNLHDTIGIDLVAMCVNDLLCVGARPLFFLDYYATSKLEKSLSERLLLGITEGCVIAKTPLIGGETAEMPGLYAGKDYDLAGFAVGEVSKSAVIDGRLVQAGDILIGLVSSGFHSNGYSWLRKIFEGEETLERELLTPTKIYVQSLLKLFDEKNFATGTVRGCSHITGGGFTNVRRINPEFNYVIDQFPELTELNAIFSELDRRLLKTKITTAEELFSTFNMGIGMVLVVKPTEVDSVLASLRASGEKSFIIGHVESGSGEVFINRKNSLAPTIRL